MSYESVDLERALRELLEREICYNVTIYEKKPWRPKRIEIRCQRPAVVRVDFLDGKAMWLCTMHASDISYYLTSPPRLRDYKLTHDPIESSILHLKEVFYPDEER